jgi:hypothetical protein
VRASYKKMQAHRDYRSLRTWEHQIQALEVTYGDNGWHVHIHALLFYHDLPDNLEGSLTELWLKYVTGKAGRAVMVTFPKSPRILGAYMTKSEEWAEGQEIALGDLKEGGESYFDFLVTGQFELAREFALATAGRNRLTWSRGSKTYFGIADIPDRALVGDSPPLESVDFATLEDGTWKQISGPDCDRRELVLELASSATTNEEFYMWLDSVLGDD